MQVTLPDRRSGRGGQGSSSKRSPVTKMELRLLIDLGTVHGRRGHLDWLLAGGGQVRAFVKETLSPPNNVEPGAATGDTDISPPIRFAPPGPGPRSATREGHLMP